MVIGFQAAVVSAQSGEALREEAAQARGTAEQAAADGHYAAAYDALTISYALRDSAARLDGQAAAEAYSVADSTGASAGSRASGKAPASVAYEPDFTELYVVFGLVALLIGVAGFGVYRHGKRLKAASREAQIVRSEEQRIRADLELVRENVRKQADDHQRRERLETFYEQQTAVYREQLTDLRGRFAADQAELDRRLPGVRLFNYQADLGAPFVSVRQPSACPVVYLVNPAGHEGALIEAFDNIGRDTAEANAMTTVVRVLESGVEVFGGAFRIYNAADHNVYSAPNKPLLFTYPVNVVAVAAGSAPFDFSVAGDLADLLDGRFAVGISL